jgi:hypothetical protein
VSGATVLSTRHLSPAFGILGIGLLATLVAFAAEHAYLRLELNRAARKTLPIRESASRDVDQVMEICYVDVTEAHLIDSEEMSVA